MTSMPTVELYAKHSPYSDPGEFGALLDALPTDPEDLGVAARNVITHYRSGFELPKERRDEVHSRWVRRILQTDQLRHPIPLLAGREYMERVFGCCRDHTLFCVAVLRQHGIPARSRVGFAGYLMEDFYADHVVVEMWTGSRWRRFDPEQSPDRDDFDMLDLPSGPRAPFVSASEVWLEARAGRVDPRDYGIFPGSPSGGVRFIRNYVIRELAHRQRDELLLWDEWGAMSRPVEETAPLIDRIAELTLAADAGSAAAEAELEARYADDGRLNPGRRVTQQSPYGLDAVDVQLA
jgi:hypothetical protein